MTLLIALIANDIHVKLLGGPYWSNAAIVLLWLAHLAYHSSRS